MTPASFQCLPMELLSSICAGLERNDLARASATCRILSSAATRQLYRFPRIAGRESSVVFHTTLANRPDLQGIVECLRWDDAELSICFSEHSAVALYLHGIGSATVLSRCRNLAISLSEHREPADDLGSVLRYVRLTCANIVELSIRNLAQVGDPDWCSPCLETLRLPDYRVEVTDSPALLQHFERLRVLEIGPSDNELYPDELDTIRTTGEYLTHLRILGLECLDIPLTANDGPEPGLNFPSLDSLDLNVRQIGSTVFNGPLRGLHRLVVSFVSLPPDPIAMADDIISTFTNLHAAAQLQRFPALQYLEIGYDWAQQSIVTRRLVEERVKPTFSPLQTWAKSNGVKLTSVRG